MLPGYSNSGDRSDRDFDLALLCETASRVSATAPLHDRLNEVIRFVTKAVKCDSCLIYLIEGAELVLRASSSPRPDAVDRLRLKIGEGITGWVAQNREPVIIEQRAYEDFRSKLFNELPEDRFEAFLSVPVVSGGRLIGVINLQNRCRHTYGPRAISMIVTMGALVGAEIERMRLEAANFALTNKLETRASVEHAKAILQRTLKLTEAVAYRMMQLESQKRRKAMREIAEAIILSDALKQPVRG